MKKFKKLLSVVLALSMVLCSFVIASATTTATVWNPEDYEPVNPMAIWEYYEVSGNAYPAIHLAWQNPKADTLSEIRIYEEGTSDYDVLVKTIENPVTEAVEEHVINTTLSHATYKTYRVVYDFGTKETEVYLSAKTIVRYQDRPLNGGTVFTQGSSNNMPVYTQTIVKEGENNADSYVKFSSLVKPDFTNSNLSYQSRNLKFRINNDSITKGTQYKIKTTYKSDSDFDWGGLNLTATDTWRDVEFNLSSSNDDCFIFVAQDKGIKSFTNLCIKKIEIWTIPTGEEKATKVADYNCGETSIASYTLPPVGSVNTALNDGSNDVTFNIGASSLWNFTVDGKERIVSFYNIYEIIDGKRVFRAKLSRANNSVNTISATLHNVSDGNHVYEVTCSEDTGLESAATTVNVNVIPYSSVLPYEPKNVVAGDSISSATSGGINVSWINPATKALSDVLIYEYNPTDGTCTKIDTTIDKTPGKAVGYVTAPQESAFTKNFKIEFKYNDGHKPVEVYTTGSAAVSNLRRRIISNLENKYMHQIKINSDVTDNIPGIYNKIVKDGENQYLDLKINCVSDRVEKALLEFKLNKNLTKDNKGFELSFKAKSVRTEKFRVTSGQKNYFLGDYNNSSVIYHEIKPSTDWVTYTLNLKTGWGVPCVALWFDDTVEGLCIDDVKVKDLTTNEVVLDYGFDNVNTAFATAPATAVAKAGNGSATMTITSSTAWHTDAEGTSDYVARNINKYNVYEVINGQRVLRAKLHKTGMNDAIPVIKLANLINGHEYTYHVTCEDTTGIIESSPVTVNVIPAEKLSASEFVLKSGGAEVGQFIKNSPYDVSINVDNGTSNDVAAKLFVAVFDNDVLTDIYPAPAKTIVSGTNQDVKLENIKIPATASDGAYIKCMLWNDGTLSPICGAQEFYQ